MQLDLDSFYLFQPEPRYRIARHTPVSTWREADGTDFGAVRQATAFELLLEEAAEEGVEPFLDRGLVVDACEGFLRQEKDFGRMGTEAQEMVEEEVVQFVRADQVLCLLFDIAVLVCRDQFGADRGIDNIQKGEARRMVHLVVGNPFD